MLEFSHNAGSAIKKSVEVAPYRADEIGMKPVLGPTVSPESRYGARRGVVTRDGAPARRPRGPVSPQLLVVKARSPSC